LLLGLPDKELALFSGFRRQFGVWDLDAVVVEQGKDAVSDVRLLALAVSKLAAHRADDSEGTLKYELLGL
jgi:hypothetical protein